MTAAPRLQRLLDGRHGGADTGVFGDVACVVLGNVEIGADEYAFALELIACDEVAQTIKLHGCRRD
jgi:hypothetical protein